MAELTVDSLEVVPARFDAVEDLRWRGLSRWRSTRVLRGACARTHGAAFTETEVGFTSGVTALAGTFTEPAHRPVSGLALLIPGSGEVDRDADHRRLPLGLSRDLAHSLALQGTASLRYDKRGIGASGGSYLRSGLHDNHAEQAMAWQTRRIADTLPARTRKLLKALRVDLPRQQQKAVDRIRATTTPTARVRGRQINARWQRELLEFDPAPVLARIRVPVLAITGDKDLQVDPDDLDIVRKTVTGPVETHRMSDLTHLLRRDPGPASLSNDRRLVGQPVDQAVLTTVADRITHRSGWSAHVPSHVHVRRGPASPPGVLDS